MQRLFQSGYPMSHKQSTIARRVRIALASLVCTLPIHTGAADDVLRIGGSRWVADEPTRVAARSGLFDQASTARRVVIEDFDSGRDALEALLSGKVDFALAASTPIAKALLDGHEDLRVLASVSQSNRTHSVVASTGAGQTRPSWLRGKRIGVMKGSSSHYAWHAFATQHRIPRDSIVLVDLHVSGFARALTLGEVDAAAAWEPWTAEIRRGLPNGGREFSVRHLPVVNWLLVTRAALLDALPGAGRSVLRGYRRAIARMAEHGEGPARVKFGLALDWAVLADMEAQFDWLTTRSDGPARDTPAPYEYLVGGPLLETAPERVTLPNYFFADRQVLTSGQGQLR